MRTTAQVRGRGVTRPSATSSRNASRTGIRLTAISGSEGLLRSTSRDPGARAPSMIWSRRTAATRSASGANAADSVLIMRILTLGRTQLNGIPFSRARIAFLPPCCPDLGGAGHCVLQPGRAGTGRDQKTRPTAAPSVGSSSASPIPHSHHDAPFRPDHEDPDDARRGHPCPVPSCRRRRPPGRLQRRAGQGRSRGPQRGPPDAADRATKSNHTEWPTAAGSRSRSRRQGRDGGLGIPYAGAEGYNEILRLTLRRGANVKSTNRFGGTALIPASEHGYREDRSDPDQRGCAPESRQPARLDRHAGGDRAGQRLRRPCRCGPTADRRRCANTSIRDSERPDTAGS